MATDFAQVLSTWGEKGRPDGTWRARGGPRRTVLASATVDRDQDLQGAYEAVLDDLPDNAGRVTLEFVARGETAASSWSRLRHEPAASSLDQATDGAGVWRAGLMLVFRDIADQRAASLQLMRAALDTQARLHADLVAYAQALGAADVAVSTMQASQDQDAPPAATATAGAFGEALAALASALRGAAPASGMSAEAVATWMREHPQDAATVLRQVVASAQAAASPGGPAPEPAVPGGPARDDGPVVDG
jgi:hypothetical protein